MIKPLQQHDVILNDIRRAGTPEGHFSVWWLGQSGFLFQWRGLHCLMDPYLSDSLTVKYAKTNKPHVRMSELVVRPERLDMVDVASSSHNHTDHLDAETLGSLRRANPDLQFVIPEANRAFVVDRLQCNASWPVGMVDGAEVTIGGFTFVGIPAAHEILETDAFGWHVCMGYVVRFGSWTIYHSGDTLPYEGLVERLGPWNVDVAFLPINGRDPVRRVAGNLNGSQAAALAHDIGARIVIPCHYDMFTFNTASPMLFEQACNSLGQPCYVMRLGEGWCSQALDAGKIRAD